ncbi:insulinase family protein [Roseateles sp.]|uniref:M16 family metallopeptidase n=1 Tax=Roseateles sp. TaxID=1971397 RepID=UPI003265B11E
MHETMPIFLKPSTALAAALLLALPALQAQAQTAAALPAAAASQAAAGPLWGHELAQRAPDPAVRFGRLPNGLRYAIQHNETPKDGVSMRLRIGAGSLQERDEERGLAHFLEHMVFRGSADVADGEVVRMLERQGLAFGPDTNAFTAPDQTVYHFNFPKADAAALDTGLMLFREIGDRLKLDAKLVEQEKGVILAEERTRDVPGLRAYVAQQELALAGTRAAERMPIGHVKTIQAATAERLRRYYTANYRPDNATVIVVGNVDVDAVERQIRERFSDWKSAGTADAPDLRAPRPKQRAAEFVADGAPDQLSLSWLLPPDNRPPTLAAAREQFVQQLAVGVLNMHLADRGLQPGSPFIGAQGSLQPTLFKVAGQARLDVLAPPERWPAALDAAVEVLRQLLAEGVKPADLQRLLPLMRNHFQALAAQATTRQHGAIADGILMTVNSEGLHQSAAQMLAEAELILAAVTADELTAAMRRSHGGSEPLLFRSAKAGVGTAALEQQLAQSLSRPLVAQVAANTADWPYTDFGPASAIVSKTTDAELGTTAVAFANGTRLLVKPTAQEKDKATVHVRLGQGRSGMAPQQLHAAWAVEILPLGGTGKRSLAELMQWRQASGKQVDASLIVDTWSFVLQGQTRPVDLAAQLQVLAAYARDPGFRPEMAEKLAGLAPMMANQFEALPGMVFMRELLRVMSQGDARLGSVPSAADIAATRAEDVAAALRTPLAGAADVVIVGDVGVDAAIAAVQATFGAGAERPRPARAALKAAPPAEGSAPHVVHHRGRPDQAVIGWQWAMPDYWADPALSYTGSVAAAVFQGRLVETVRTRLGIAYSPSVGGGGSVDVPGQGHFTVQIETPAEKFDTFRDLARAQLRELAERPVSADEVQRARQPLVERSVQAPQGNGHWVYWLPRVLAEPRNKGAMLGETAGLQAVTAEQVQAFFRDRIGSRKPVEVVARAAEATPPK